MKLICNPMEIAYKYQHPLHGPYAYREAADPTIICFRGKYFLFTSMCGGFYYSDDLIQWSFHENRSLEIYSYAPDVNEHDGYLYFCASSLAKKCKILRTNDPFKGFDVVSVPFSFWDPHLYFEEDRAYLFWGCSSRKPIYGVEMDIETMQPISQKVELISADGKAHGIDNKDIYKDQKISLWQRYINLFVGSGAFIEGAFLNKFNGRYYLQYATPGTEFPTYGDAVCISDNPLGKYTFQRHNPYSVVPGGYLKGAGHGSTFYDIYGNLWHAASICVCVNHAFERRLGLWPAGVDEDGILFCNQYFADYPKRIPSGKFDPLSVKPEGMLLSYRKKVTASAYKRNCTPEHVADERIQTVWSSPDGNGGHWLLMDLGYECEINAIQVNFGDCETPKRKLPRRQYGGTLSQERYIEPEELRYKYVVECSSDQETWYPYGQGTLSTPLPHHLITADASARYIRVTFLDAPYGQCFTVSGLRVFGFAAGAKPAASKMISAVRQDDTTAVLKWELQADAVGYHIRIGIAPDKLYNGVLLYGESEYRITFLNREIDTYYYAVDTFNESGIQEGKVHRFSK